MRRGTMKSWKRHVLQPAQEASGEILGKWVDNVNNKKVISDFCLKLI